MKKTDASLLLHWEKFLNELLACTVKFPKRVRWTFANRLESISLDIYEQMIEARFQKQPSPLLKQINLSFEKMRLLLRLSYQQRFISEGSLHSLIKSIDLSGKMLGGWLRYSESKEKR